MPFYNPNGLFISNKECLTSVVDMGARDNGLDPLCYQAPNQHPGFAAPEARPTWLRTAPECLPVRVLLLKRYSD
jgi:hypothetical protein